MVNYFYTVLFNAFLVLHRMHQRATGFSILPKAYRLEQSGIKPPTFGSIDDLLYILYYSQAEDRRACLAKKQDVYFG